MIRFEGDRALINISRDEYSSLLLALGFAIASTKSSLQRRIWLKLANAINEGHPNWMPYKIEEVKP